MEFGSALLEIGPPSSLNFPIKWKMNEMDCVGKERIGLAVQRKRQHTCQIDLRYCFLKCLNFSYTFYTSLEFES